MPQRLLVVYRGPGAPLVWQRCDERGRPLAAPVRDANLPADADATCWVVVPAEAVLLLEADLRVRDREQLERALPFAIEDQLADTVESMHVAAAPHPGDRAQLVLAVARTTLDAWRADLEARGVRADALVPEHVLLPATAHAQVLIDGPRAVLRVGAAQAAVAPTADLDAWLAVAGGSGEPEVHAVSAPALSTAVRWQRIEDPAGWLLARLAASSAERLPNLLTGAAAPRHRGSALRRSWRLAAALAAAAVAVGFVGLVGEWWWLRGRVADIEAQMATLYREVWPASPPHPDPAGRMRSELGTRGGAPADALALLAAAAPALASSSDAVVRAIDYRDGALDVQLLAGSVATLDRLRETAAALPGLEAELAAATTGERGAEGRLRIRGRNSR